MINSVIFTKSGNNKVVMFDCLGMKSVSITIRSAWKIVRKWGLMKLVQLYDKMSSKGLDCSFLGDDWVLLMLLILDWQSLVCRCLYKMHSSC